jgi:hypothetical protein
VPEGLRPGSIRRAGRAWQPRWRPSARPLPAAGGPGRFGLLHGGRRSYRPRGMGKVLARRLAPTRVQVLIGRAKAPAPAPPRLRILTLSPVLPAGPAIIGVPVPRAPRAPASAAAPLPLAHAVARLERIALTSTIRVESAAPPGLPGAPPPAAAGPRGEAGGRGPQGVPGSAPGRPRPALVVRSSRPRAEPPGRPEPPPTVTADALRAVRPAGESAMAPPPMPGIDEITTQVIRRIERRATAQRERLARPPRD